MAMLLHLCLCLITVIQVTPSQAVTDVRRQTNDVIEVVVNNCGRTEQVVSQLETVVSQIQTVTSQQGNNATEQVLGQLVTSVSQIQTAISQQLQDSNNTMQVLGRLVTSVAQLQSDVDELKAGTGHDDVKGKFIQQIWQAGM